MNPLPLLGLVAALVLLGGCVPKTDTATPLSLAEVNADLERELSDFDKQTLNKEWWKGFGDPQLNAIMAEAQEHAPSLKSIQARYAQAESIIRSVESRNLPGVSADAGVLRERFSENHIFPAPLGGSTNTLYHPSLGLRYDFDFWNARESRINAAKHGAYAQKAYLAASKLALAGAICETYLAWHYDEEKAGVLRALEQTAQEEISIVRRRYALGLCTGTEVRENEQKQTRIHQRLAAQGVLIEGRKKSLCVLAGFLPSRASQLRTPAVTEHFRAPLPEEIVLNLLSRRPDIAIAKYTLLSKGYGIEHARAQFYPNIVLSANLGFTSFERSSLFEYASATPGIGIALSLPLFDGGEREANLQNAASDYNASVYEYNDAVIRAANEVVGLLKQSAWLEEQIRFHREELVSRGMNEKSARKQHLLGLSDKLPVLERKCEVLEGELGALELANAKASLQIALVRSLGGGYREGKE
ncbi:MAG: efflux transporter outer membrane subunit [Campylobacterota bacterium]